jgi:hypothetical protein
LEGCGITQSDQRRIDLVDFLFNKTDGVAG